MYPSYSTASAICLDPSTSALLGLIEQSVDSALPARQSVAGPVGVQPVKAVPVQPEPRAVGEVVVHPPSPHLDRHPVIGLLLPRHKRHLKPAPLAGVEHGSAEQKLQRHVAVPQRGQVLGPPPLR